MEEKKEKNLINPLRNEIVIVRLVPKDNGITDKKHLIYGGMMENATRTYTVPLIASTGSLKNVLTDSEKAFFEDKMGINLSVYNKVDNYWYDYYVTLNKEDNILDLSDYNDYIKYKVLLANTLYICPSLQQLKDKPLATYQYVIIEQGTEDKMATKRRKTKAECYKLVGKIEDDFDTMKTVVEALDKRPISDNTSLAFLANKIDEYIDMDVHKVYDILTDETLSVKVLIKKAISKNLIAKIGGFYYLKTGKIKVPMAEEGKDPDLKQAVLFLNNPKNQETKFNLEAQVNK